MTTFGVRRSAFGVKGSSYTNAHGSIIPARQTPNSRYPTDPTPNAERQTPNASAGFTLIEMLVATMVFITGFVAVFALFLAGVKMRATADLETRSAIALRNLVEEIQLDAGLTPQKPAAYLGSGFPAASGNGSSTYTLDTNQSLYGCPGMPGMFYAVVEASDGDGTIGTEASTVVHLRIIQLALPDMQDGTTTGPTWDDVARRLRITDSDALPVLTDDALSKNHAPLAKLIAELVRRGIATDDRVAIVRQPSWL